MTIKRLSGLALMNIHEKFYEGLKNGSFNSCKGVSQHEEYSKNEEEGLIGQCSKKKPTLNQDQHISLFCKRLWQMEKLSIIIFVTYIGLFYTNKAHSKRALHLKFKNQLKIKY